jgi:hypothetical protein
MRASRALVLVVVLAGLSAPAAQAETVRADDPAGDGLKGRRLDVTSVQVDNRDHAMVVTVDFVRAAYGDLGIRLATRSDRLRDMAGVFARHWARGDHVELGTVDGTQPCPGLTADWDDEAESATVRVPSRCFRDGGYGAVRIKVITEIGSDADLAPDGRHGGWRGTPLVSRG